MSFEESAAQALEVVTGLLAAAEEGRGQMLDMRERIVAATTRFETDWALLRERARTFVEQSAAQEQQLVALKVEAGRAADALREGLEELVEEGAAETDATVSEFAVLTEQAEETGEGMLDTLRRAEAAESSLQAALREVEAELEEAVADAENLMRAVLVGDLNQVEQDVEREAIELSAYLTGQCVPVLEQKSYDLYTYLLQAEEEVRYALEASLEANEAVADAAMREAKDSYDDTLHGLGRLGTALEELLEDLQQFVESGRERLKDRHQRWEDGVTRARTAARDAIESLREAEQFLSRFSFSR